MNPLIQFEQVDFAYQQHPNVQILKKIDFAIQEGEFVTILGHNGSGKSTLAKHMNGLLLPTAGKVLVNGLDTADPTRIWSIRQQVGMVFQNPDNQFVAPTVIDDVAFGLENLGISRGEMLERIEEALNVVGMTRFKDHEPHRLSGGQKQRVAIAGILAMKPRVIVFDESTSMLDPIGRKEVIQTAKRLNESGITVVNITHDVEEALLSDRVIVMNKGQVVMDGRPQEVFMHVEQLKKLGLDVPFLVELIDRLKKRGMPIHVQSLQMEHLVEELWNLL